MYKRFTVCAAQLGLQPTCCLCYEVAITQRSVVSVGQGWVWVLGAYPLSSGKISLNTLVRVMWLLSFVNGWLQIWPATIGTQALRDS